MSSPVDEKKDSSQEKVHLGTSDAHSSDAELGGVAKLGGSGAAGKLRNPLVGIPHDQLMADVETFAADKGLTEHIDVLKRGALVAQNPHAHESIDELSQDEKDAITYEHNHKWSHPMTLYLTIFLCSLGAATQGWDQTGSNGANLSFPVEFGVPDSETIMVNGMEVTNPDAYRNSWIIGVVNAAPYIASAFLGCWLSDPLNNLFGRRGTIFITAIILIVTPICSGLTHSWQTLFVVRLILGIGMGAKGSTVPVFAAENAPTAIRGALVMGWQLWTAFGIFLGFAANVVVADTGRIAWRLQLGSAFIPALPLAIFIYFCPESPRWLMKKNRYPQAYKSLVRLRHTPIQAARDIYYIHVMLIEEAKIKGGATYIQRFTELFTIPRVRRATLAAGVVMLGQQLCGINVIAFYSSTVFKLGGFDDRRALYASLGFGALNFVFAFPALYTIDTFGRRSLLLVGFPTMALFLLVTGLSFLAPNITNAAGESVIGPGKLAGISIGIYIFSCFYSFTEGPVPFAYSAEVFPLAQREQGMAFAVAVCLGFAALLSITFPPMLAVMKPVGAFCFYAGLNVLALVLIILFLPETKGLSLEELDSVFNVPTASFVSYSLTKEIPYFLKGGPWRKDVTCPPLVEEEGPAAHA